MRPNARWQDWAIFSLGLWLAVSPWLAGYGGHPAATADAAVVGLVLALAGHFEASCELSIHGVNLVAGLWLLAAPFVLGFDGLVVAAANSVAVGAAVTALAVQSLGLDRDLLRLSHTLRR